MSDAHVPETQPTASDEHQTTPAEIEQTLEQIGSRYIADLRTLSEKFGQFYGELLATKDTQIAECEEHVEALDRELSEIRAVLVAKEAQIAERDEHVEALDRELSEVRAMLATKGEQIAERDEHVEALDRELSEARAILATKGEQIAERDEHVEALDRELSEARAILATKGEQIAHLKQRAEHAERDRAARAAQVRQFEEISARYLAEFQRLNTELGLSAGSPSDQLQASTPPLAAAKQTIVLDAEQAKPATTRTVRRFVGAHYHVEKLLRFAAKNNLTKVAMGEG